MIQPTELASTYPMRLHGGVSTTTAVWEMLSASERGDLGRVTSLADENPALVTGQYDYTPPLHLAVLKGHTDVVRFLIERGGIDPEYRTHPFVDSLIVMAKHRGAVGIANVLQQALEDQSLVRSWGDTGKIDFKRDEAQERFEQLVDQGQLSEVSSMLEKRPDLTLDQTFFWGEGILAGPANNADLSMIELLMDHGAKVPDVSKWGARYYFKHYEVAAFLLERGMNPNHVHWQRFTLLHDMVFTNDVGKAELLLNHGADIDAIDEEYRSTPLGYAVRLDRREMVALLLDRGADPNAAGAEWSRPLTWAIRRGNEEIAIDLRSVGATS